MRDRNLATDAGGDTRRNPHVDQSVAEPVGIVAAVPEQRPGLWNGGQERPRPDVVRGLASREEHADRAPLRIGQDVQFGVQPTLCSPDQPSAPLF